MCVYKGFLIKEKLATFLAIRTSSKCLGASPSRQGRGVCEYTDHPPLLSGGRPSTVSRRSQVRPSPRCPLGDVRPNVPFMRSFPSPTHFPLLPHLLQMQCDAVMLSVVASTLQSLQVQTPPNASLH